ncbi:MAG: hypothetical protein PHD01_13000 [Geobacteraceae bacterium]|nr:hypothetical protein [Geobacteraceae bacterium]
MTRNRANLRCQLQKAQIDNFTRYAVEGIWAIQARIHGVNLTGGATERGYNYEYFKEIFQTAGINKDFIPEKRMPGYKTQIVVPTSNFILNIFVNPFEPYFPPFFMEVIPKESISFIDYKKILSCLNDIIPNMKNSSVEYALDLFCSRPEEVENLFMMVRRSLFVRFQKESMLHGEASASWGNKTRMNFVYNYGGNKAYERGDDDKKTINGWNFRDLNRVRLEHTAKRDELKRHGIKTLDDLLEDCRFKEINEGVYNFQCFGGSKKLPSYWDWPSYSTEDKNGNSGAFQVEYNALRKTIKNIGQYKKNIVEFDGLKVKLVSEMIAIDAAWKAASII